MTANPTGDDVDLRPLLGEIARIWRRIHPYDLTAAEALSLLSLLTAITNRIDGDDADPGGQGGSSRRREKPRRPTRPNLRLVGLAEKCETNE